MSAPEFTFINAMLFASKFFTVLLPTYLIIRFLMPRIPKLGKIPVLKTMMLPSDLSKRIFFVFSFSMFAVIVVLFAVILPSSNTIDDWTLAVTLTVTIIVVTLFLSGGFERSVSQPLRSVALQSAEFADKNLAAKVKLSDSGFGEARKLVNANRQLANVFRTLITNMKDTTNRLAESAEELAAGSEEVAATTEEVTSTIQNIAEGAAEQVRQINQISEIIKEIENIIEISISEIASTSSITKDLAEQTNLISLNAAIEAARAGASGQGFGVVADQVRKLSIESKNASASIENTITEIGENIKESVARIAHAVNTIQGVAENTAASSEEAAAAAEEQAASLQEITEHAQKLSELADKSQAIINEWKI